jgi:thiamine biosynthesis lipoprotein
MNAKSNPKSQIPNSKSQNLRFVYCNLFVICALLFVISLSGCQQAQLHRETQVLMGTYVEVISPDSRAPAIVFSEIRRIEGMLSKYRAESEVSQLNKNGQVKASPEMFYILEKSVGFWELSGGAFDVTVGPLMDLWGFTKKEFRQPSDGDIQQVLKIIGSNKIILNKQDYVVKFMLPGMRIDLGAIGKGFAVDCAVRKLKDAGITSCLINAGGQIFGLGDKFGRPWKVAIRSPRGEGIIGYLEIKDQAVSTSGDYEQYFEKDKRRFSHIMNPHTGYPEESKIISATVIAGDGLTADALSTSIVVLGKDKGLALGKKLPGVSIKLIEK